jgi:hypothetical protein
MTSMYADHISVLNTRVNSDELWKTTTININKVTQFFEESNFCTNLLKSNSAQISACTSIILIFI